MNLIQVIIFGIGLALIYWALWVIYLHVKGNEAPKPPPVHKFKDWQIRQIIK